MSSYSLPSSPPLKPSDKTSNWPLVHIRYNQKDQTLVFTFSPGDFICIDSPPEDEPAPSSRMTVLSTREGRILSIGFSIILSHPPATTIQLYDPCKDALTILFIERTPETLPEPTPTYRPHILLYMEEEDDGHQQLIGIHILSASRVLNRVIG